LGREGTKAIAEALESSHTLTTLYLGSTDSLCTSDDTKDCVEMMVFLFYELLWAVNGLGVEGAKLIARALESNHTLMTLNLSCTDWYTWPTTPKGGMIADILIL
jgi:hypothetical protein